MYGAPEFNHYNLDCTQMARHYGLPCYSTAGVGDASQPGVQATAEKMLTLGGVPRGGAQYIHYAFGLLERTNVFCPVQAILDDAHIGMIKHGLSASPIGEDSKDDVLEMVREVMDTEHRTYMYHLPLPTQADIYVNYPLESEEGDALYAARQKYDEIMESDRDQLPDDVQDEIKSEVPGVLDRTLNS
jgi:trimethylamine--corrinoid protein Co-methyltransferase